MTQTLTCLFDNITKQKYNLTCRMICRETPIKTLCVVLRHYTNETERANKDIYDDIKLKNPLVLEHIHSVPIYKECSWPSLAYMCTKVA